MNQIAERSGVGVGVGIDASRRRSSGRGRSRLCWALALILMVGCASPRFDGLRGARLYASGSRALEMGEARRAVDELETAARLIPHASEIQNHLGLAYWAEGDVDRARTAFDRALELDCDNEAARRNQNRLAALTQPGEGAVDSRLTAAPPPVPIGQAGSAERDEAAPAEREEKGFE